MGLESTIHIKNVNEVPNCIRKFKSFLQLLVLQKFFSTGMKVIINFNFISFYF